MQNANKPPIRAVIIGCGGVGSYLVYPLARLLNYAAPGSELVLVDGDVLEEKNLVRQHFSPVEVDSFKVRALGGDLHEDEVFNSDVIHEVPQYFTPGMELPGNVQNTWLFCCADNHTARKACLSEVDNNPLYRTIIGANEYTDAEAYFYEQSFKEGPLDPRVYYPELASDEPDPDDPLRRRIGCNTGQALTQTPQLVNANFSAANAMLWLFWFHYFENRNSVDREHWPIRHCNNFAGFKTVKAGELMKQQKQETLLPV